VSLEDTVRLVEYQDWVGELDDEDALFISNELLHQFTIRRAVRDPRYVLNPNQFVGVLSLPSGRRLESRSKVPVSNLFRMLAAVLDFPSPFRRDPAEFDRLDELFEFVAAYFAELVENRIDQGLYRSYAEKEENLAVLRGRIDFAEDMRHNYALRHRTFCRYAEFTWDIPENQIVRYVVNVLSGWDFSRELRLRLSRIDAILSEVTLSPLSSSLVDRFSYHRLNDDYRPIHQLCRLFLEGWSLSEEGGPFEFRTFLLDMNVLFEKFVTRLLQTSAPERLKVEPQRKVYLDESEEVLMRPDVVLCGGETVLAVADCKYKRLAVGESNNDDLYQVLAYCTALNADRGMLIYPLHERPVRSELKIRHSPTTIRGLSIDLGKKPAEFGQECDAVAKRIFDWATDLSATGAEEPGARKELASIAVSTLHHVGSQDFEHATRSR
jgi:5-methylcytosine-specific restriction enzyme subunit McrC